MAPAFRHLPIALLVLYTSSGCSSRALPPEPPPQPGAPANAAPILVQETSMSRLPVPTRRAKVVDHLFGVKVADPYRWLENGESPAVKQWIHAENRLTRSTLSRVPARAAIRRQLEKLLAIEQISLPTVKREKSGKLRLFYTRRAGQQNQPVLYVRDGVQGKDRELVDPNRMSAQGTVSLDWYYPSQDGSLLAYGISENGSENSVLHIRNVDTGKDLPDVITRARYASVCWMPDNKRFFYSRFPAKGTVPAGEEKYHRRIYEHVLGRKPDKDPLVFGQGRPMTEFPACVSSPDGRWLVVRVSEGWSRSELFIADTRAHKLAFKEVTQKKSHIYDPLVLDDKLYIRTNEGAPRYALYEVDPRHPERKNWRAVLPQHPEDVLDSFNVIGGQILVGYLDAAVSRLERFDSKGRSLGKVPLPTLGSSDGFTGVHDGKQAFYNFESFATPPVIRRITLDSGKARVWQRVHAAIKPKDFVVTQHRARSKDGTAIPYFVVSKKNVDLASGRAPTLLYGYGGFNVSLEPRFSRTTYVLLDHGGVYVQANLRGGGEFGEDWHRAGQLEHKQNVFDDFAAVAKDLIAQRVTDRKHLAIYGASNGGLLVTASITQHPELFRAAVASVPLTDMLRYDRFLIAKLWVPEYGSPEDKKAFKWLYAYSPYHHVVKNTPYPAVLLTTASSDTRVAPMHARKMAGALQYATSSDNPVLLRTETKAGHGAGKPISKVAEEYADLYSFLLWQLGVIKGPPEASPGARLKTAKPLPDDRAHRGTR